MARLLEMQYLFPDNLREISGMWSDLARVLLAAGDRKDELAARREAYKKTLEWNEVEFADEEVVVRGSLLAISLFRDDERTDARVREAHVLLPKVAPLSRRTFGPDDDITLESRKLYAKSLYLADAASQDDVAKATTILEDVARTARRRASCECADRIHTSLAEAHEKLASLQRTRRRSTRTQAALEAAVLAM